MAPEAKFFKKRKPGGGCPPPGAASGAASEDGREGAATDSGEDGLRRPGVRAGPGAGPRGGPWGLRLHRSGPRAGSRPLVAFQSQPEPRPWPRDGAGAQGGRRGLTSLPGRVPSGSPRDAVFAREPGPAPPHVPPSRPPLPQAPAAGELRGGFFSRGRCAAGLQRPARLPSDVPASRSLSRLLHVLTGRGWGHLCSSRGEGPRTSDPTDVRPRDPVSSRNQSSHAALRPQGTAWKAGGWGQQGFLPWVRDARVRGSEPGKGEQAGVKAEPAGSQTSGLRLLVALGKRATFSVQIQPHLWSPPKH